MRITINKTIAITSITITTTVTSITITIMAWESSIGPPEGKRALPLGKKPYIRASYLGGSAFFGFHKDICGVSNAKTFSIKGLLSHDS